MNRHLLSISTRLRAGAVVATLITFTFVGFSFHLAWSGSFHFDDLANLGGLKDFQETGDWLAWIVSGNAGPGGRGVALASFLLDGLNWPHDPSPFLRTNTLIHLVNGLLAALVFSRLAQATPQSHLATFIGLLGAGVWVSLPILISTVLIPVQRMTLLAAMFMLLGAYIYLLGRTIIEGSPKRGGVLMAAGVVGGTTLGFLSKENAATLPLLILICELTVLKTTRPHGRTRKLILYVLIVAPSFALIFYLIFRGVNTSFSHRDFSLSDRVFSQTVILWDYLRLSLLPQSHAFSPFHDDYPVHAPPIRDAVTALALVGWFLTVGLAFYLRTRLPLFSFAVLWFLGAHAIESSVIPLEMYFEHRNYIALLGPAYALVGSGLFLMREQKSRVLVSAFAIFYMALLFVVHVQTTSLWGNPALAAEIWYSERPVSLRAAQNLSGRYIEEKDFRSALTIYKKSLDTHPRAAQLSIQGLQLSCQVSPNDEVIFWRERALTMARIGVITGSWVKSFQGLFSLHGELKCSDNVGFTTMWSLGSSALANPDFRAGRGGRAMLHFMIGQAQLDRRDLNTAMLHIEKSLSYTYNYDVLSTGVAALNSAGLFDQALKLIEEHEPRLQGTFLFRFVMKRHAIANWEDLRRSQSDLVSLNPD